MVLPLYQTRAIRILTDAGAEIRPAGAPRWLSLEDGSPQPGPESNRNACMLFILRPADHSSTKPKRPRKPKKIDPATLARRVTRFMEINPGMTEAEATKAITEGHPLRPAKANGADNHP